MIRIHSWTNSNRNFANINFAINILVNIAIIKVVYLSFRVYCYCKIDMEGMFFGAGHLHQCYTLVRDDVSNLLLLDSVSPSLSVKLFMYCTCTYFDMWVHYWCLTNYMHSSLDNTSLSYLIWMSNGCKLVLYRWVSNYIWVNYLNYMYLDFQLYVHLDIYSLWSWTLIGMISHMRTRQLAFKKTLILRDEK